MSDTVTASDYAALVASQEGCCAICGRPPQIKGLALDVSEKRVRGLLCGMCSAGLGLFEAMPERLDLAAQYLRKNALKAEARTQKARKSSR